MAYQHSLLRLVPAPSLPWRVCSGSCLATSPAKASLPTSHRCTRQTDCLLSRRVEISSVREAAHAKAMRCIIFKTSSPLPPLMWHIFFCVEYVPHQRRLLLLSFSIFRVLSTRTVLSLRSLVYILKDSMGGGERIHLQLLI